MKGDDCFYRMKSVNWKIWKALLDRKTCLECKDIHGKVYPMKESVIGMDIYRKVLAVFGMKQILTINGDIEGMIESYIQTMA